MTVIQKGIYKGIICLWRKEKNIARKHFLKSKGNCSDECYYSKMAQAYISQGFEQEGFELLNKAIGAGYKISENTPFLWDIYHSKEYAEFCEMRE